MKQMVGFGGAATFALAARNVLNFEKRLVRLKIQSGASRDTITTLRKAMYALSDASGESTSAILDGVAGYVSMTGSITGAQAAMETFARTSIASGAAMEDVVKTAASLQKTMNVKPEEFEKAMSILLKTGKAGSQELKDVAEVIGTVAPQFQKFGEEGAVGLARLGAAFQVVAPTFNFAAKETATGIQSLMTALMKNAPRIKKLLKVDVYKEGGEVLKTLPDILTEMGNSKLARNPTLLIKALGRIEAVKTYGALQDNAATWGELYKASLSAKDVAEDYAEFQESHAGKMARSWERMKNTIARVFTPERVEKFAGAMEKLAEAVAWMADNMRATAAILIGMKLSPALLALIRWKPAAGLGLGAGAAVAGAGAGGRGAARGGGGGAAIFGGGGRTAPGRGAGSGRARVEARRAELKTRGPKPAPARGGGLGMGLGMAFMAYEAWQGDHAKELERAQREMKERQSSLADMAALGYADAVDVTREIEFEGPGDVTTKAYRIRRKAEGEYGALEKLMLMVEKWQQEKEWEQKYGPSKMDVTVKIEMDERGMVSATQKTERKSD
jgi:TP901 family phage tail tape measure protein